MQNNQKPKVRQNLAYLFGIGTVVYFFVGLWGHIFYGVTIAVPEQLVYLTTAIVLFYFGTEAGKEKPDG